MARGKEGGTSSPPLAANSSAVSARARYLSPKDANGTPAGVLGASEARSDFAWAGSDEPHAQRRKAMLAKYPQIQKLYGPDHWNKAKVFGTVFIQAVSAYLFVHVLNVSWPVLIFLAWIWGGTFNHSLMLAIHELSHDLFFPATWQNQWFGLLPNACLGVPLAASFRKYHLIHHRYQGLDGIDPDLPTSLEGRLVRSIPVKIFFLFFQQLFYAFRPLLFAPVKTTFYEILNYVAVAITNYLIFLFFGWKTLAYFLLSTVLGAGLHPLAAHFIAEHYTWQSGFETYSYYGPLNHLVYNVGWHNEHHDFPRIPGSRLPQLHQIAPEFYSPSMIGIISSWPGIMWRFIFDPALTPFSRIKRKRVEYAPDI